MTYKIWWMYARVPLLLFVPLACVFVLTLSDVAIAQRFFFDAVHGHWMAASNGWTNEFLHTGGRWMIRVIVLAAASTWIAACVNPSLRSLRRPAGYLALSLVLSTGLVGVLKIVTNVHCPWDLEPFGGHYPVVALFATRSSMLRQGQCFPAAHASSGYALLAVYFAFRERNRAVARAGVVLGLVMGLVFGLAQQARGAHFVSHDLWSAFIVWMVALTLYTCVFNARLWDQRAPCIETERKGIAYHEKLVATEQLLVDGAVGLPYRLGKFPRPASQ